MSHFFRFLLVLIICCPAAYEVRCQQLLASNTTHQPEFISGFFMDSHQRTEMIADIIVASPRSSDNLKIGPPAAALNTTDDADKPIKKTNPLDLNDTAKAIANEPDSIENRDTTSLTVTMPEPLTVNKPSISVASGTSANELSEERIDPMIARYAEMIETDPTEISNYPLYRFIDQWYGIPYRWGGEDVSGIDCSAFSQKLYGKVYTTDIRRTVKLQHKKAERIKDADDAEEGDLVFFRIHHVRVSHVGIYLANGYFVHASRTQGVVISNLSSRYWRRRFAGCGRIEKEDKSVYESDTVQ